MRDYMSIARRVEAELKSNRSAPSGELQEKPPAISTSDYPPAPVAYVNEPDPFANWQDGVTDVGMLVNRIGGMYQHVARRGASWTPAEWNERRELLLRLYRQASEEIARRGQTWRDYGWGCTEYGDWYQVNPE